MKQKRPGLTRTLLIMALALIAGATALAQRGGYQGYYQSYTGNVRYDGKFVFVRMAYPWFGGRGAPWSHDYPTGEEHFMTILSELTSTPAHVHESSIMSFGDPEMFKFPVIYLAEPGFWSMNDDEVKALRAYLQKGGFLILDDNRWNHWGNIELQVSRVFPEAKWFDLDHQHPIFHSFFEIDDLNIIPQYYDMGRPVFRAILEDNDPRKRIMIMVNYNTDISEFWEWSNMGYRPIEENNEAYKLGVNEFMYGITH